MLTAVVWLKPTCYLVTFLLFVSSSEIRGQRRCLLGSCWNIFPSYCWNGKHSVITGPPQLTSFPNIEQKNVLNAFALPSVLVMFLPFSHSGRSSWSLGLRLLRTLDELVIVLQLWLWIPPPVFTAPLSVFFFFLALPSFLSVSLSQLFFFFNHLLE